MRVCFIAPHSITMVGGGPQTQILSTLQELRKLGVEVDLFNQWESFDKNKYDLYHLFVGTMLSYDIAMRLKHFNQKFVTSTIFYTLRSPLFIQATVKLDELFSKFFSGLRTDYKITKEICEAASHVLPNTSSEANLIIKGLNIDENKVTVIPNGVDNKFDCSDKNLFYKKYGVTDFVLNVGHIGSKRKNVLNLIRAMENIDAKCVIIGKIHNNRYSEECLNEASKNKMLIIDGLPNGSDMLASAYHNAKVFALPSLFETPGIAALEAGLAGCNIVITKHGGTNDYFKDFATYVEPTSINDIRKGIENEMNKDKSNALKAHIKENFLWAKVAEKTLEVYKKVLG